MNGLDGLKTALEVAAFVMAAAWALGKYHFRAGTLAVFRDEPEKCAALVFDVLEDPKNGPRAHALVMAAIAANHPALKATVDVIYAKNIARSERLDAENQSLRDTQEFIQGALVQQGQYLREAASIGGAVTALTNAVTEMKDVVTVLSEAVQDQKVAHARIEERLDGVLRIQRPRKARSPNTTRNS